MYIDLGAEQILAAERGEEKIAVEIKSFIGSSSISEFHTADDDIMAVFCILILKIAKFGYNMMEQRLA